MSTLQKAKKEVLEALFEGYKANGGTPIFDVTEIIQNNGLDPAELGHYLVDHGWVKHQRFGPRGFAASITLDGINEIDPGYIQDNFQKVISVLGISGNEWYSIMQILELEPKDFQIAFDIAKFIESSDMVEAQYRHNDVILKLNLSGRDYYETNKASFLNL